MLKLQPAGIKWWGKPLVTVDGRPLPAELVVLRASLGHDEGGAWLNSRGTKTGARDLRKSEGGGYETVRTPLPEHVQECLRSLYSHSEVRKGVYDLVIWSRSSSAIRFVEVKCPKWDRRTPEQRRFEEIAREQGIPTEVIEWEFEALDAAS